MKPTAASETVTCNVCGKTLGRNDLRGQRICRRHYHLSNRNPQQYMAEVRAWKIERAQSAALTAYLKSQSELDESLESGERKLIN